MKLRMMLPVLLLILALALCGCGTSAAAAPTPEPTPEATPEPTPEPTPAPTPRLIAFPDGSQHYDYEIRLDLSELKHEDVPAAIEALKELPQLFHVDLGQAPLEEGEEPRLLWSDIASLQEALPGVEFLYRFRISGYDPVRRGGLARLVRAELQRAHQRGAHPGLQPGSLPGRQQFLRAPVLHQGQVL